MEIKTLNFFGETGITSTSANHIANLAKEAMRQAQERLHRLVFYDEYISLLTSSEEKMRMMGMRIEEIEKIPEIASEIAQAHGLIAYLREAIKEKERLVKAASVYTNDEARAEHAQKLKELRLQAPCREEYPTSEDILRTFHVGEVEKYLSLQAEAAALGKLIHEDGSFSDARIQLMKVENEPISMDYDGANTIVHKFIPSAAVWEVNVVYNSMQKHYREVQAELNGMKNRIQETLETEKLRIDTEFAKRQREYEAKEKELQDELSSIMDEEVIKRDELLQRTRSLKICIPHRYKMLVSKLQKNEQ